MFFKFCRVFKGKGLMRREASSRQFGGGGGCTDPFSVFTFLAFALAVMDLVMEMNRCSMHINITALIVTTVYFSNHLLDAGTAQEEETTGHRFCEMHGSVTRGGTGGGVRLSVETNI